ncbi:MAG: hypothetical protein JWP25_4028 [Bradyrhizobium sp.]|nr:hypothetical protein [Bradyrhizobium sp.]
MRVDDIDAAFEKAAGGADHDQADWAVYFNKALLNTFSFVSDYVFVHGMAETLREPDVNEAHRKLLGEMAPVANDLSEFTFGFAAAIFKLHFGAELTMTVVAKIADAKHRRRPVSVFYRNARSAKRVTYVESCDRAVELESNAGAGQGHHDIRGEGTYPHRPQEAGRR